MKNLVLAFILLTTTFTMVNAQGNIGHHSDNYSGVYALDFNPAEIVDSRYRFHMNIVSFNTTVSNNYLGIKRTALFKDRDFAFDDPNFDENYIVERLNGKNKGVYADYSIGILPSMMFNFGKKAENAIGISFKTRMHTNVNGVDERVAREAYAGLELTEFHNVDIQNKNFSVQAAAWNEVGLTYGREVFDKGTHYLKAAGTVKFTQGLASAYFYSDNLDVVFPTDSTVTVVDSDLRFGYSNVLSREVVSAPEILFQDLQSKIGVGFDAGVTYEWRPNIEDYKYELDGDPDYLDPRKNKYKLKAGIGLIDMGYVKFQREELIFDQFDANAMDIDFEDVFLPALEDFENGGLNTFADTLSQIFNASSSGNPNYSMSLPMRINAYADYNIWRGFYANFTASIAPAFKKNAEKTRGISEFSLTPRYEHKWFAMYIPASINTHGNPHLGLGLRAGPLVIGTNDITPLAGKGKIYDVNFYTTFSMPIGKKIRDKDKDHVSKKFDNCRKDAGTWPTNGCPDSDEDGITDDIDKCPEVKGIEKFEGCPDTDGDGIADSEDDCPEVAGLVEFKGCPDTDEDGIADSEDECPEVAGTVEFMGCPDTDGDGVQDSEDECPEIRGSAEFKGCPDTDGDGLGDLNDDCPDIAGPLSNGGCPEDDSDKDGVIDAEDDCPEVAGPASNNGCPDVKEEDKEAAKIAFDNLEFETGKAVIRLSSYVSLDNLAQILKDNPTYKIRIAGHTDNVGSETNNMKLSRERAISVKVKLMEKGIANERFIIESFGETQPIAPNTTPAGRQENRRVELELL